MRQTGPTFANCRTASTLAPAYQGNLCIITVYQMTVLRC